MARIAIDAMPIIKASSIHNFVAFFLSVMPIRLKSSAIISMIAVCMSSPAARALKVACTTTSSSPCDVYIPSITPTTYHK